MNPVTATGHRQRRIWALAGPIILSNLSVPLLGMIDTAVVGHLPEARHIGAVALGAMIIHFLFWAFGFLRMSTTGLTAQACGAEDGDALRLVLGRGLLLAIALALVLLLLQAPLAALAFRLIDAEPAVTEAARGYYGVRIWAAPATLANYVFWGWFLGLQNSRIPLIVMLLINGCNALLDYVFVMHLGMAAEGVALASLIAEYLGLLLALGFARRTLRTFPGRWSWPALREPAALRQLLRVNHDLFLRTLGLLGALAFFTIQGARFGELILAANAVLFNFQTFMAYGLDGFAHTAEALVGRALGAGDRQALRRDLRDTALWSALSALLFSLLFALAGQPLIGLLTDIEAVRSEALRYLPWVIALPLVSVWAFWLDGVFIGATRSADLRRGMLLAVFAVYLPAWYLLQPLGNHGLWAALLLFMAARGLSLGGFLWRRPLPG
ncbi:MATE family efflux transporter [Thiohalobacter sp. IOR34]|uniref:MATE family efflux transporter n=1 Tax=Thiohalobacter sp. IOR34 TaxID=3057176 RepID=UPI0025B1E0CF|nr:MATE family efflux transporter [Thiohalobacter sp. IOR34]WJW76074.1 MATE family efflux transporter [Thiohalobacter sp. IOR34]